MSSPTRRSSSPWWTTASSTAALLQNASLATATASRAFIEDPLTFGVQVARRFPQARTLSMLATGATRAFDRDLLATWLSGDLAATRALVHDIYSSSGLGALAAEVAQAAGLPELVVDDSTIRPVTRARAAWQLGEASRAIGLLEREGRALRLHRALRAELALMTPGTRLRWTRSSKSRHTHRHGVVHLLTNSLPHTRSGYTIRTHSVLKAQRDVGLAPIAMTRIGYPVVVGGLTAKRRDVVDGIDYYRALPSSLASTPDGRLAQQARALAALATRVGAAALQTTTPYTNPIVVREVAERLGLPWAYEVRGMLEQTWVSSLATEDARERARTSERYQLIREREAELSQAAGIVFTLSESMRDDLSDRGVERDHVQLVPNGIESEALADYGLEPADARELLGLPRDGFWVGSTSSIVEYEGFDVLLEACRLSRERKQDVRVLLVGDGAARQSLESLARELGLAGSTVFTGRVPQEDASKYRQALDLFVIPRLDRAVTRTVSPLKPIEAMASGRPVIVSDLPGLRDSMGPDLWPFVSVPPGSPDDLARRIEQLAADATERERLASLGRARARTRTWKSVARTYRSALDALIGGCGSIEQTARPDPGQCTTQIGPETA